MKRIGKILSLLLIAVMLLALLPNVAFADPPQNDPSHQHKWVVTYNKKATCTEAGKKTWKCSLCGKTYTETYKALGHDWDEGEVTTAPSGLTPGVKTYTCKRDASHTRTEEIDPLPWVFAMLSGVTIDPSLFDLSNYDIPPLVITEQPKGGSIIRWADESVTLHVAATGGIGEYTYEWHSHAQDVGKDEKYNDLLKWFVGLFGVTTEQVDAALEASLSDTDTLVATSGNESYYCVVTDAMGNSVRSDMAAVSYKISIAKQPDNVNLQESNHEFYCEAIDGSGNYTYRWYDHDEGILGEGQSYPAEKEGYYYCIVTDNVTGETATSEYCEVYSTEPFRLVNITQSCEILPGEDTFVVASFDGGVEEYEIWWDKDGTAIDSVEGRDEQDNVYSRANVDGAGKYTVHGVDSMYATASASVTITAPKLTIVAQPVGGTIPKGSYTRINVVVADGEMPYTYILYRNGEEYLTETDDDDSCPVGIWDPGNYYYHIEDSKGRSIDSNVVTFENEVFRITKQPRSGTIKKPGETLQLTVEAKGGVEPYTYLWSYKQYHARYKVGESQTYSADKPGEYMCRVVDADGNMIHSKATQVGYTGDEPFITSQPESGILKGGTFYLSCDAVSGSGGELRFDWEVTPTGVRPSWSNVSRRGNSSRSIDADKAGTYRCKVTDTKTGKYVYTQAAFVKEDTSLSATAEIDMIRYWGRVGDMEAHIRIKGGVAPYTVKLYVVAMAWTEDGRTKGLRTILYRELTANTPEEASDVYTTYTPYQEILINENGEWRRYTDYYVEVYAEITDAEGTSFKLNLK